MPPAVIPEAAATFMDASGWVLPAGVTIDTTSPGRYVTMQTLRDAIEAATGGRSTEEGVRRAVVRIRAAGVVVECC